MSEAMFSEVAALIHFVVFLRSEEEKLRKQHQRLENEKRLTKLYKSMVFICFTLTSMLK